MPIIPAFWRVFDLFLYPIVWVLNDLKDIKATIELEQVLFKSNESDEASKISEHAMAIQARAAGLLGHVSVMVALSAFALSQLDASNYNASPIVIELLLYLFVAVLCLRNMKSFGFSMYIGRERPDAKTQKNDYEKHVNDDIVFRYAIQQLSIFVAVLTTIAFVATLYDYRGAFNLS